MKVCRGELLISYLIAYMCTDKSCRPAAPKLQSSTLRNIKIPIGLHVKLLDVLEGRCDHGVGLKHLVVESCRVFTGGYEASQRDLAENVTWKDVT